MTMSDEKKSTYARATAFNFANPPGSPVLAWPGTRDQEPLRTRTRSGAWVLPEGQPVVMVKGYAGGIHLDHIEPDPARQPAVPDIEFEEPPCPICDSRVDSDGDSFTCRSCEASWDTTGTHGSWETSDAQRCPAMRSYDHPDLDDEQCCLAEGHDIDNENHRTIDGLGSWTDTSKHAVIDAEGQEIAR